MPKVEIDYSNTIIYKITCNDSNITDVYVGHTTNFVQRKHAHKDSCANAKSSNYKCKLYETIRCNGGWSNWKMEIINFFNCADHYGARKKEQEYFVLLNANLNSIEPLPKPKIKTICEKKITQSIVCQACNLYFGNLQLLEKHNNTHTHLNTLTMSTHIAPFTPNKFACKSCSIMCNKLSDWNRHLLTTKHIVNEAGGKSQVTFECECGNIYKERTGLWKHKKKCVQLNNVKYETNDLEDLEEVNSDPDSDSDIEPSGKDIIKLMKMQMIENQEIRGLIIELLKKEATNNNFINNTNISNNNCNNKSFNLNLFLNEQCKDAMNINEFVDTIKMQLSDLENFAHLGYADGVSNIFVKGINALDVNKRPIHCSDIKREVLYIKSNDEWVKETDDKPLIKSAIKRVAFKNIKQINEWVKENPECKDPRTKKFDKYNKIVMNAMSGVTEAEQQDNIEKIVKNVTKAVTIEKYALR